MISASLLHVLVPFPLLETMDMTIGPPLEFILRPRVDRALAALAPPLATSVRPLLLLPPLLLLMSPALIIAGLLLVEGRYAVHGPLVPAVVAEPVGVMTLILILLALTEMSLSLLTCLPWMNLPLGFAL